jgi:6-phosphogluconate dehydrogenase
MDLAMIGLGRMGMNMAKRLLAGGHRVVAYNRSPAKAEELAPLGALPAYSLAEAVAALTPPRVVWLMLPAGETVDQAIDALTPLLAPGDILIEGGNTHYKDDLARAARLNAAGVRYVDAGVSGGIWGLELGYCTMVGGPVEAFRHIEPILQTLAPPNGYMHCGPTGAGHFVKMVHNGIEYGMMQAYAEGFALLEASEYGKGLDFAELSALWNQGSVIRSWLLELAERAFRADGRLESLAPRVDDSGEGRWMLGAAVELSVPLPVLAQSLFERFRSRETNSFADRLLAALRREFGGHAVTERKESGADA